MKKYLFLVTPVVFLILCLMKQFRILQGVFGSPVFILLATIILSIIIAYVERNAKHCAQDKQVYYENLDIVRFLFAIVVLLVHMRPFLGYNDQLDLAFNNMVGRVCVPIYFITTGYFCAKKQKANPTYIKSYIKAMLPVYIVWSILYLPLGIEAISMMGIPQVAFPAALLVAFLYIGTYYHLWYFPALFLALFVLDIWKKHFSMRSLLIVGLLLLCFGATETYFGMLPEGVQYMLSTFYFKIFYTTRNFLFFGLFYVALGYVIGDKDDSYVSYSFFKFLFSCMLLVVEALMLQSFDRLDSNIMFSCVPLTYYLFITLIHSRPIIPYHPKIAFRDLYKYYYFLHPAVIYLTAVLFGAYTEQFDGHYWIQIMIVIGIVQLLTILIVHAKKRFPNALKHL